MSEEFAKGSTARHALFAFCGLISPVIAVKKSRLNKLDII
jgi:hypothetical protein